MLKGIFGLRRFSPDTGAGGGTGTPPPTGSDPGQSNAGGGTPGQAPAPASSPSGDSTDTTEKTEKLFTQAELDQKVKERLAEEKRRAEKKAADDKRAADEKALADNAQWQTLAEQRAQELATAKAQADLVEGYAKRLNALVEAEIATWPDEVKALDPGAKQVDARLDWLERSRPLAKKLASLPKAPATEAGTGSTTPPPAPAGQGGEQGKASYRFTKPGDVSW